LPAEAQRAAKAVAAISQRPVCTGAEPDQDEEDDLLPSEVLDAVMKQSRCLLCACMFSRSAVLDDTNSAMQNSPSTGRSHRCCVLHGHLEDRQSI